VAWRLLFLMALRQIGGLGIESRQGSTHRRLSGA
jgi:hypothetical protein